MRAIHYDVSSGLSSPETSALVWLSRGVEMTAAVGWRLPRRCRMDGHAQICRVLSYDGNGYFTILRGEEKVFIHRDRLTFHPGQEGAVMASMDPEDEAEDYARDCRNAARHRPADSGSRGRPMTTTT